MSTPDPTHSLPADELLRHARWLHGLARSLVLDDAEADDLVQETWLRALTAERASPRDPRAWLAGVARNVARNRGRSRAARRIRERSAARTEAQPSALEGQEIVERQRALLDRVEALGAPFRATLLARYFEGLPPRAIARRDGIPLQTVKSRLARALERLRRDLDAEHGDRRRWGLYLLPLARDAHPAVLASRAALIAASLVGIAAVTLLGLAVVLRGGSGSDAPVAVSDPAGARSVGPASDRGSSAGGRPADEEDRERRPAASAAELLVRVRDGASGTPVEGALVRYLDGEALKGAGEALLAVFPDVERALDEHGRGVRTGPEGEVRLPGRAPWLVRASQGARLATSGEGAELDELELRLAAVPRLVVRVEDDRGRPVAGVAVKGSLEISMGIPGREPEGWEFGRATGAGGEASFLDPMAFWEREESEREGRTAAWTELRIDVPGVPESAPGSVARMRIGAEAAGAETPPVRLVLPATGALEIAVVDGAGEALAAGGTVFVEARGADTMWSRRYEAPLVAGRARYPRAALGMRFRAMVHVPELGATWTAEGAGPRAAGERAEIEVVRPANRAWTATVVDQHGAPVAGARAYLYLEDTTELHGPRQLGPIETSAEGALRVELPAEAEPAGPFHVGLWRGPERAGFDGTLEGDPRRAHVDLGRHAVQFGPAQVVRGRCVDPEGDPLGGISVAARARSGLVHAAYSGADGSFQLSELFPERVELEVHDPEGRWLTTGAPLVAEPDGDEVFVVLSRGAELSARLVLPEIVDTLEGWLGLLYREGAERPKFASPSRTGELRWEGLAPGTHRLELRMLGSAPLVEIADVRIESGENRDPRLDAIDLGALLRRIRVDVRDPEGHSVRARRVVADAERILHQGRPGSESVLVPTGPGWSLYVVAPGWRVHAFEDLEAVGDELEVRLRPGIEVELLPRGAHPGAGQWKLVAEWPLERFVPPVPLPDAVLNGEPSAVRFAAPGRYRLIRELHRSAGERMSVGQNETSVAIEVADLDGPQAIELDLTAAAGD